MNEAALREEICRVGRSLFDRGYVHATAGNISVRLDNGGFLITPTDACLGFLQVGDLAPADLEAHLGTVALHLHRRLFGLHHTQRFFRQQHAEVGLADLLDQRLLCVAELHLGGPAGSPALGVQSCDNLEEPRWPPRRARRRAPRCRSGCTWRRR